MYAYLDKYLEKIKNNNKIYILYNYIKDFAKQRYNTPYACNVI